MHHIHAAKSITSPKILIAGFLTDTVNYQKIITSVGLDWDTRSSPSLSYYDGLLLPGGGDLPGALTDVSPQNWTPFDQWQLDLLHYFVTSKKPVLGICKGMQLINLYFGGRLYVDLFCSENHCWNRNLEKDQMHHTCALSDTLLYDLYGKSFHTNSAHHQGCARIGLGLMPIQYSDDCVIEAIHHVTLPIIGLQWHPERMSLQFHTPDMIDGSRIFSYFAALCAFQRSACQHTL